MEATSAQPTVEQVQDTDLHHRFQQPHNLQLSIYQLDHSHHHEHSIQQPAQHNQQQQLHLQYQLPQFGQQVSSFSDSSSFIGEPAERKKKTRTMFSNYQLHLLETTFQQSPYPDSYTRKEIANRLALNETRIQVWFQNRRAKWRKTAVS